MVNLYAPAYTLAGPLALQSSKTPQSNTGPPHVQFNLTRGSRTSPFSEREAPRSLGSSWGIHDTANAISSFQSFVSTTYNWTFASRCRLQVRILYSGLTIMAPGTTTTRQQHLCPHFWSREMEPGWTTLCDLSISHQYKTTFPRAQFSRYGVRSGWRQ